MDVHVGGRPWPGRWVQAPSVSIHRAVQRAPVVSYTPLLQNNQGGVYYSRYLAWTHGAGNGEDYLWTFDVSDMIDVSAPARIKVLSNLNAAPGAATETVIVDGGVASYASAESTVQVPAVAQVSSVQVGVAAGSRWLRWAFEIPLTAVQNGEAGVLRLVRNQGTYLQVLRVVEVAMYLRLREVRP